MAIDYEWRITQCDYLAEHAGKDNVIHNVHWEVMKTDGEYMGRSYGSVPKLNLN
tara:strand:- start:32 stop:193 length:162 start_codon:yes stop_codon:yes gene_type:complete